MLPVRRPDPAPSRWKYRLERLWLTPVVRYAVQVGLPAFALGWMGYALLSDPGVQATIRSKATEMRASIAAHPSLMVTEVKLTDVSPEMRDAVSSRVGLDLPMSSMDLDLNALHQRITGLEAIAAAQIRLAGDGVMEISVEERVPHFVWRHREGLELVDANGIHVGPIPTRAARADLPILIGDGADAAAAEAVALQKMAAPIATRIRAMQRIGARRWNIVLTDGPDIYLPEEDPEAALARVMALHEADDILSRQVRVVDMRDGRRPILRVTPDALYQVRRGRGLIEEDDV
ncbi:MAG: cell division protein FtsQ/DivIB [Pseudomonadota bacterium]